MNLDRQPEDADRRKAVIWYGCLAFLCFVGAWKAAGFRWAPIWPSAGLIAQGLWLSIQLSILSTAIGLAAAIPLAVARVHGSSFARIPAVFLIEIVRATPELMVIFWVYFGAPAITGQPIDGWTAALVAMSIIAASYLAEVIRAGLYSVDKGQWEAAASTGLNNWQSFKWIILPQAISNMMPALLSQVIMLFKTTSLVSMVGVIDFFRAAQITNSNTFSPYAIYTLVGIGYFIICGTLSLVVKRWRGRVSAVGA
ncbi:amine acid ABC transporter, permease protein, 3-TM region, His/Glu/Gln/Arg/opine family [Mesorhizobium australicum WSM2073]|uniref:Amine acid ABC transporter, permease protein, 3-TM region, His/Glu/Gln/Arg/opine family n=3 Tax=Mesorhizobium TaxID=68287 RepID=L0KVF7_MESAW|nr:MULTISPECIES: amino acid ABC transporter permease [Mesorhizobium]ADV14800.1 polar amino acid ABC transporter, inner membrane subunit [Mesorhizobium ciceri biovar biserrulae WSM1271]AEH90687.1 polar amino acid ABC transporter, inner membrane subunit [Mesorhizobium opportunistum WSM2075]AGB48058.1 amine acid ABC transporter, permease protein, 3-TM region, His/Glu/Gln/Arg/opine family [Mesorhizobium australicum WSM2073]OBP89854.1 polar amino acid ABC transporter permease [Mesorhizobium loti]